MSTNVIPEKRHTICDVCGSSDEAEPNLFNFGLYAVVHTPQHDSGGNTYGHEESVYDICAYCKLIVEKHFPRFMKDGNVWCAVRQDFVNLQESPAGFGETREMALKQLISEEAKLMRT